MNKDIMMFGIEATTEDGSEEGEWANRRFHKRLKTGAIYPEMLSYTVGAPSFSPYRSWIRQFAVSPTRHLRRPLAVDILRTRQTFYQPHQTYEPEEYCGSPY
jgi:hypothetical protein